MFCDLFHRLKASERFFFLEHFPVYELQRKYETVFKEQLPPTVGYVSAIASPWRRTQQASRTACLLLALGSARARGQHRDSTASGAGFVL